MRAIHRIQATAAIVWLSVISSSARCEDLLTVPGTPGIFGGRLTISSKVEPKTLNPLAALDTASREVIGLLTADLMPRNLNRCVELIFPVEDRELKRRIRDEIDAYHADSVKTRTIYADGTYKRLRKRFAHDGRSSQDELLDGPARKR